MFAIEPILELGIYPFLLNLCLPAYVEWEITDVARHPNGVGYAYNLNKFTITYQFWKSTQIKNSSYNY